MQSRRRCYPPPDGIPAELALTAGDHLARHRTRIRCHHQRHRLVFDLHGLCGIRRGEGVWMTERRSESGMREAGRKSPD